MKIVMIKENSDNVSSKVYDDLKEAFRAYSKDCVNNCSVRLYVVVELKRRQSIESYKKQVLKAFDSFINEKGGRFKQLGLVLKDDFDGILESTFKNGVLKKDDKFVREKIDLAGKNLFMILNTSKNVFKIIN